MEQPNRGAAAKARAKEQRKEVERRSEKKEQRRKEQQQQQAYDGRSSRLPRGNPQQLASYRHPLDPLVLLFYFHLGEAVFIVPVVLCYGRLFGGATSLAGLLQLMLQLSRRQAAWTAAAGLCIAVGYLCYFATRGVVPRAVAYAFGCAAGSTGMLYGLLVFAEYAGASRRKKALLLLALGLYPSSIALIALSMS